MEKKDTVILYTYRYFWKQKDGKLCVKFITGPQEEHAQFQNRLRDNNNIESAMREYVSQVNLAYLGFTEEVKKQIKEEKEIEKNEKERE